MSSSDRPATKAFVDRRKNLHTFFKENKRGPYDKDFADWCDEMGLSNRTARENYWNRAEVRGVIRIVYEKRRKFWEYCNTGLAVKEDSETPFTDYVRRLEEVNQVRQKMGLKPLKRLRTEETGKPPET